MKIQEVMTAPARSCRHDDTLVEIARAMWDYDCGCLPVLDGAGRPAGMITDRDVCMALARQNRFPGSIRVREAMSPQPIVCGPHDEVAAVLVTMGKRQVRRLPVVDGEGILVGIVSINDIAADARAADSRGADEVHRLVVRTLLAINERRERHGAQDPDRRRDFERELTTSTSI
jgi:CBS domain-containing protein